MEGLVDLLPLLFIGLYYLLASRRKARVRKAAQRRVEAPQSELVQDEPRAATPFQTFLDQLEEAMQEANGSAPEPEPVPPPVVELPERPRGPRLPTATPEFRTLPGSFDAPTPVDHDAHGFGRDNPLSEERFEQAPAFAPPPAPADRSFDPHGLRQRRRAAKATKAATWRRRLRDPEAARDAFVLQTIFGPRGGIRGDRPKR
ncbi:hypothetical protein [Rubrivirga sp.]|uniref:hypothetical protein n=1 Tax=Rubrivirga sp. TaxID=1885344 RepID=UPI003B51A5E9